MDSYGKNLFSARAQVEALLAKHGVVLQEVAQKRRGERWATNEVYFLDRGRLRLIFEKCDENFGPWLELTIGHPWTKAAIDSAAEDRITVSYYDHYAGSASWLVTRRETDNARALLETIDPQVAELCLTPAMPGESCGDWHRRDRLAASLQDAEKEAPDSPFFLALVDKIIARFAAEPMTEASAAAP